jgi:glyoxylase-like metal-dependent hydrolase (beta-lactamase superfamily II)
MVDLMGLLNAQSSVRSLTLGEVRLTYLVDGAMWLTPEGFFPGIPGSHWAQNPSALADGRVAMSAGGLLVERDGRKLLIDAGLGTVVAPMGIKGSSGFGSADSGALPETLAGLGHSPADIEAVAYTHLHVDHTGWAFVDGEKFFPEARYLVAAEEWEPHGRGETIPGAPGQTVIGPMAKAMTLISDGEEVFPGVHALVTPGHSPGHTSFIVSVGSERVIAFGDAFHVPAQIAHPDWPSLPDVDGVAVLSARRRLAEELQRPGTIGFGCHFGDQVFGRVTADLGWEPVEAAAVLPPPR